MCSPHKSPIGPQSIIEIRPVWLNAVLQLAFNVAPWANTHLDGRFLPRRACTRRQLRPRAGVASPPNPMSSQLHRAVLEGSVTAAASDHPLASLAAASPGASTASPYNSANDSMDTYQATPGSYGAGGAGASPAGVGSGGDAGTGIVVLSPGGDAAPTAGSPPRRVGAHRSLFDDDAPHVLSAEEEEEARNNPFVDFDPTATPPRHMRDRLAALVAPSPQDASTPGSMGTPGAGGAHSAAERVHASKSYQSHMQMLLAASTSP